MIELKYRTEVQLEISKVILKSAIQLQITQTAFLTWWLDSVTWHKGIPNHSLWQSRSGQKAPQLFRNPFHFTFTVSQEYPHQRQKQNHSGFQMCPAHDSSTCQATWWQNLFNSVCRLSKWLLFFFVMSWMYSGNQKHLPSKQIYISKRNQKGAQTVNTLLTGLEAPRSLVLTFFPRNSRFICVCVCVCVCE